MTPDRGVPGRRWQLPWLAGLLSVLVLVPWVNPAQAAVTLTVTTTVDALLADGQCSIREAIQAANLNASVNECIHDGSGGTDTIAFNIPGAGPHIINAAAGGLEVVTAPLIIDGTTEPSFAGTPVMVVNGAGAGVGANGFTFLGGATGSTLRGFVIQGFSAAGVRTDVASMTIQGNYIGTTVGGNAAVANTLGIRVNNGSARIGGATAAERNLISGNTTNGIRVESASIGTVIRGNYIGVDATGNAALANGPGQAPPNEAGILIFGVGTVVGGSNTGERNVISGNRGAGVNVQAGANNTTVLGNIIGLNAAGSTALANGNDGVLVTNAQNAIIGGTAGTTPGGPCTGACNVISGNQDTGVTISTGSPGAQIVGNFIGMDVSGDLERGNQTEGISLFGSTGTVVGGTTAASRNVISGNSFNGVRIGASSSGAEVAGNVIGTNAAGTAARSNGSAGVLITETSVNNVLGGTTGLTPGACTGPCNLISGNDARGVNVTGAGVVRNRVLGNSIDQNGALGIDLGADGVTANDATDADAGPNNLQNFPDVTTARTNGAQTQVIGSLTSTANTNDFRVELFSSPACDGSGNGEGRVFLGATTVNTTGNVGAFNVGSLPATTAGHVITATATSPTGDTSELSACQTIVAAPVSAIVVNPVAGLVTTESGGQAQFSVVLSSAPIADVTIPVSSNDLTEGTVSTASLVFTPANALVPQTVTVTGVDDPIVDGNTAYLVVLGAATSTDIAYNGQDSLDVAAMNQDNEAGASAPGPAGEPATQSAASLNDPNNDEEDERKRETDEERRQRARTNRGNRADERVEGNVVELRCDQSWPSVVMANRDGDVEIKLVKDAQAACGSIRVGDYLDVEGDKQHELLYHGENVTILRNGNRVK